MEQTNQSQPKYHPSEKLEKQIKETFTYHPPKGDQTERYVLIRGAANTLALTWAANCPESRELSAALTLLQQANMMANAAIACNE